MAKLSTWTESFPTGNVGIKNGLPPVITIRYNVIDVKADQRAINVTIRPESLTEGFTLEQLKELG